MLEIKIWLTLVLFIEVPAIAMLVLHTPMLKRLQALGFDWLMAVGMYLATFGLFAQVTRTHHYLKFNTYPVDEWFPLWVTKDIGISIMIFCVTRLAFKKG
jgi:hypothetical protein